MKSSSSRLQGIHRRALWAAMRAAGGDAKHAATALGMTVPELIALLDRDPASIWSVDAAPPAPPATAATDPEEDPDGSAW